MKFEIKHITNNEEEYEEIMKVIEKWARIDELNRRKITNE